MLAIDLGSRKVCIAEGTVKNGIVNVESFAEAELKNDENTEGVMSGRSSFNFIINELIKSNKIKSKSAVITFNSKETVTREFRLPDVKPAEMKLLVAGEMSRILGDGAGYVIDYTESQKPAGEDKMKEVTAYAAPRETVASCFALLRELKLKPVALDVHANAISKLLSGAVINDEKQEGQNTLALDTGYSEMIFHGFSGGVYKFSRTEGSPVKEFVREIGSIKRIDVSSEDMAGVVFTPGHTYESAIMEDTCRYFIYRISEEIRKYIQYISLGDNSNDPLKVYIYGGITAAAGIDAALSDLIRLPVSRINSIDRLSIRKQGCDVSKLCNAAGALIRM